jgi:hypothetical protein
MRDIINATNKVNARVVDLMFIGHSRGLSSEEYLELQELERIAKDIEKCINKNKE